MTTKRAPVVIELEAEPGGKAPDPASAPRVDTDDARSAPAMERAAMAAARRPSRAGRFLRWALGAFVGIAVSVTAWDFAAGLLTRAPWLGWTVSALGGVALLSALALAFGEWRAVGRLRRVDGLRGAARAALGDANADGAQRVVDGCLALYRSRPDLRWAVARFADHRKELFDADALLAVAERELMAPLDAAATQEIEAAVRRVAVITAFVPLALADVAAALWSNLRMVRRIAEIYGGRAGVFGSMRLMRAVMLHLVATGAVSVGDDLVHSVAGGGLVGKLSRRFGEGVVNGALTARVGVVAMELCRPLPFEVQKRPRVTGLVGRALAGVFGRQGAA